MCLSFDTAPLVNKKAEIPQFRPIVCDNSENP